jgi:surfeit locus 1 family protein
VPRSGRQWTLLVAAIAVAAVCVRLGVWQLDRLEGRRAFNEAVEAGLARPRVEIDAALDEAGGDASRLSYRPVQATGRYDAAHEVILYGRTLEGRAGNHVLTPLVIGDGRAVLVDRGWVPFEEDSPPLGGSLGAPSGEIRVEGVLRPSDTQGEQPDPASVAPVSTVKAIDLAALDEQIPFALLPQYLQLSFQNPPQPDGLPAAAPLPELSEGPHLGYAVQWFAFAITALVGYALLLRRDRRDAAADTPTRRQPPAPRDVATDGGA